MKELKKAFKCDHCRKILMIESAMKRHEEFCSHNPKNFHPCFGCRNLRTTIEETSGIEKYGSLAEEYKSFFCDKKQIKLIPSTLIRKKHPEKYPQQYEGAERMPSECSDLNNVWGPFSEFEF